MDAIDSKDFTKSDHLSNEAIALLILKVCMKLEMNTRQYVRWTHFVSELQHVCFDKGLSFQFGPYPSTYKHGDGHMNIFINNKEIDDYVPLFKVPYIRMQIDLIEEMIRESDNRTNPEKYLAFLKRGKDGTQNKLKT